MSGEVVGLFIARGICRVWHGLLNVFYPIAFILNEIQLGWSAGLQEIQECTGWNNLPFSIREDLKMFFSIVFSLFVVFLVVITLALSEKKNTNTSEETLEK